MLNLTKKIAKQFDSLSPSNKYDSKVAPGVTLVNGIPLEVITQQKRTISAILKSDLSLLDRNFPNDLAKGKLVCSICNTPLSTAGIHSVKRINNSFVWRCKNKACLDK